MKRDVAEKWIEALESGKYQQTTGRLYDGKGYCCLGVLCDVLGCTFEHVSGIGYYIQDVSGVDTAILPKTVMEEAGMKSTIGDTYRIENGTSYYTSLVKLNDSGKTFPEIAQHIREHVDDL